MKMEIEASIWNRVDIAPPPVCTVKSKWCKEIRILNATLEKITTTLDSFNIILNETKLLSAILKQFKGELRMDKIYQLANKVIQCVKKCQVLNLKEVVLRTEKTSRQCIAFENQPSRQMLEYNLVRIVGFTNLLKFLVDLCHQCAVHLKGKMEIGHFPTIILTLFSILSRIWSVSNYFLANALEWYLLLVPSLKFLEPTPINWLPSGFEFPALPLELEQVPWINQNKTLTSLRSFLSDFDEPAPCSTNLLFLTQVHDLGETISREDFHSTSLESRTLSQNKKTSPVKSIRVQDKSTSSQKMSGLKERNSRKIVEIEPGIDDLSFGGKFNPPVKHFFKTKYTRSVTAQKPQSSEQPVKKIESIMETVSSNPVKNSVDKESNVPDFMRELAALKLDMEKLRGQASSTRVEQGVIDPKFKRKVVVVKGKKASVSSQSLQSKVEKSDFNRIAKVDKKIGERVDIDSIKSVNRPIVKNVRVKSHVGTAPAVGTVMKQGKESKKSKLLQKRLEKKKEIVKLKKKKSTSWVIS